MVESHHPLPQDVHEAMRGVSHEPIRERLLGGVASLHEVIRVDSPVTPSEAIDPASQELYRSERASARITQIADRSVTAYTQLQAEAGVEPEHTEVWRRVLQGQLAEAATARDTGQEQEAQELLGQYLATAQIAVSELPAYERDKQLKEIMAPVVKSGLGNDLVEAGRNSYGLVTVAENPDYDPFVGDPNKYVASSVAHGIESVQSALELSKGATISLDPAEASLRPMSTTAYGAKLKSASLEDRVLAHSSASLEQDGSAPERVERLKDAVITSVTEEWVDPDQYAQALSDTLDGNPHELQRHANAFAKVRLARYVGSRYRTNSKASGAADVAMVKLYEAGRPELATQLLTANAAERTEIESYAIHYVEQDEQAALLERIDADVAQKRQALSTEITTTTPEDRVVRTESLVLESFDPESSWATVKELTASPDLDPTAAVDALRAWRSDQRAIEGFTVARVNGVSSPDLAQVAGFIASAHEQKLKSPVGNLGSVESTQLLARQLQDKTVQTYLESPDLAKDAFALLDHDIADAKSIIELHEQFAATGLTTDKDKTATAFTVLVSSTRNDYILQGYRRLVTPENVARFKEFQAQKPEQAARILDIGVKDPDRQVRILEALQQPAVKELIYSKFLNDTEAVMASILSHPDQWKDVVFSQDVRGRDVIDRLNMKRKKDGDNGEKLLLTIDDPTEVAAMVKTFQDVPEGADAKWFADRRRWVREYFKQDIEAYQLARAWKARPHALQANVKDSPNAIIAWAVENELLIYAAERAAKDPSVDVELVNKYPAFTKELSRVYAPEDAWRALEFYASLNQADNSEQSAPAFKAAFSQVVIKSTRMTEDGERVREENFTAEILDRDDPRGFTIGIDTGCCQRVGGAAETCVYAGYSDSRYGFFAVTDQRGQVRAQSFMYVSEVDGQKVVVLDNIEANDGTSSDKIKTIYRQALSEMHAAGKLPPDTKAVQLGTNYSKVAMSDLPMVEPAPSPRRGGPDAVYSDASTQRLLLTFD